MFCSVTPGTTQLSEMDKNSVIIDFKRPKNYRENFKVTPSDFSQTVDLTRSCAYDVSRPLLWMMRILGRIHYTIDENGWMQTNLVSLPFVYSATVFFFNVGLHFYYLEHFHMDLFNLSESITFQNFLLVTLVFMQWTGMFTTAFSWFFEVPAIVRNFNRNAVLESKLVEVFPTSAVARFGRTALKFVLVIYCISLVVGDMFLLFCRYHDKPWPMMLIFMFNCAAYQSYTAMWCLNNLFIVTKAVKLKDLMKKNLHSGINRAQNLAMYRKAWTSIWEQSQKYANSFSTTVIWCLVGHSVIFVTSTYGLIVSLRNFDMDEALVSAPYFVSTGIMVFSIVESGHQAKNKLGDEFIDQLIDFEADNVDRECQEEVEKFMNLIIRTDKAQITLKGYLIIARPLFVSFLSVTVTYLIVLLQFRQSEETCHTNVNASLT